MADEAPESSMIVRRELFRTDIAPSVVAALEITTTRSPLRDDGYRAVTKVYHSHRGHIREFHQREIGVALKGLPGFSGSYSITMGREFEVEWDGVRAPV